MDTVNKQFYGVQKHLGLNMFDLTKAFNATYNPDSGLYLRKDRLVHLIPEHLTDLRRQVTTLIKKYTAKLVVKILTEGYPDCPCCGKAITKPNMSGNQRDEFIKTCGSKKCQSWYLSKGSDFGKDLQEKAKSGFHENLQPYMEVVAEKDFGFVVRCTRCGSKRRRSAATAATHCNCSKGEKVRDTRALNMATEKATRLSELREYLPSTVDISHVHDKNLKVDVHCTSCDTTQTMWLGRAINWRCSCGRLETLEEYWDSLRAARLTRVRKHLRSLGLKYLGTAPNGKYRVLCKCGTEFVPNQLSTLTYGCKSCSVKATAPRRIAASRATCRERYGVDYASQDPIIHQKTVNSSYRTKQYRLGKRLVNVRGYEPQALDYIIAKGIPPEHIYAGGADVPSIRYRFQGKDKVYFPDILLSAPGKRDMLIEVKSTWTIRLDTKKIFAKQRAAEKAGYAFRLMVMDAAGQRLDLKKVLKNAKSY